MDVVEREFRKIAWADPQIGETLEEGVGRILSGQETPYSLGARILKALLKSSRGGPPNPGPAPDTG